MQWDLGLKGLGLLTAMSLRFGVIAQLVAGEQRPWLWLIAAAGHFIGGLFISEVWFEWATQQELQPNIDGLSFDEVLLLGLVGIVAVLATQRVTQEDPTPFHRCHLAPIRAHGVAEQSPMWMTCPPWLSRNPDP